MTSDKDWHCTKCGSMRDCIFLNNCPFDPQCVTAPLDISDKADFSASSSKLEFSNSVKLPIFRTIIHLLRRRNYLSFDVALWEEDGVPKASVSPTIGPARKVEFE